MHRAEDSPRGGCADNAAELGGTDRQHADKRHSEQRGEGFRDDAGPVLHDTDAGNANSDVGPLEKRRRAEGQKPLRRRQQNRLHRPAERLDENPELRERSAGDKSAADTRQTERDIPRVHGVRASMFVAHGSVHTGLAIAAVIGAV